MKLGVTGAIAAGVPLSSSDIPPNYNLTTNILTATANNETYFIQYTYILENTDTVDRTIECQWLHNSLPIDYSGVQTLAAGSSYIYSGNLTVTMQPSETLQAQFKSDAGGVVQQEGGVPGSWNFGSQAYFNISVQSITTGIILQTLRGELGQWDFLKGIMTMFNLVTLPDEDNPNNIKFEPYADIFINDTAGTTLADRTIQHDWTDKVDVAEMKLEPLTDLNKKTIFKFVEDDDDFCFMEYKRQVGGHLYGSKLYDASLSATGLETVFQGTDEIVAEPFAATIIKPLMPQYSSFITPAIYASSNDETEGFDNSPRIMYNNGVKSTGVSYYIPEQNGLSSENQEDFLQFSHLSAVPTVSATTGTPGTLDFHFGICQLTQPVGDPVPTNLFNIYWLPYYAELYNEDTRIMTIKVNLSPADINTFKFNDLVMIKNRSFRVNKIDYKPNDLATVEFILIP
tara:strand:- start:1927 stop:3294 length:1368 start_codon:yes stop_codon:yes gene_type:complete